MSRYAWPDSMQYPKHTQVGHMRCIGGHSIGIKIEVLRKMVWNKLLTNLNGYYIPLRDRTPKQIASFIKKEKDHTGYKRFCFVTNNVLKSRNQPPLDVNVMDI